MESVTSTHWSPDKRDQSPTVGTHKDRTMRQDGLPTSRTFLSNPQYNHDLDGHAFSCDFVRNATPPRSEMTSAKQTL